MTHRDYPRLSIEDFGTRMLLTGDIDPVYVALNRMEWDTATRDRWLVAYWCCYHPGAAGWIAEQGDHAFWHWLMTAAWNTDSAPIGGRWPRAPERRHWRGANAVKSVECLQSRWDYASDMVNYCAVGDLTLLPGDVWGHGTPCLYADVAKRVQEHVAFGPWIAFKVADMLERCCGVPVVIDQASAMYESPTKAAYLLWRQKTGFTDPSIKPKSEAQVLKAVLDYLGGLWETLEAPGGGRNAGLPEYETILCKWGSHMSGHYPVDNDLIEIRAGAEPWAIVSPTVRQFLHHMPLAGQPRAAAA
jgi:hypothetical protein